ncbi:MAG: hypothetical protein ACE5KI_07935 [Dehalococcoidia bacterium]
MGKLIDKLEQAARPAPRRLGFAIARDEGQAPSMILIVRLDNSSAKLIKSTSESAHTVILQVDQGDRKKTPVKDLAKLPENFPWGLQAEAVQPEAMASLREAGCDYLVFGIEDTPGRVLNEENIGKVLSIDMTLEEQLMRVLEEMPTDAIFIDSEPKTNFTVKVLMEYRSVIAYVSKPVLLLAPLDLSDADLTALQNVGVIGLVVEPRTADDMKKVTKLRKAIDSLPPRESGEKERVNTLLPHTAPGPTLAESMPDEEGD